MEIRKQLARGITLSAIFTGLALTGTAIAQEASKVFLEEIIVTATKRAGGIDVQDAPVAITAYNDSQLDAMYIRDLKAIGYSAPSVQLEDIGTSRGVANFSIRGLGINSSIPSIDPTVGVFVDGMYLGLNSGVVLDIFDLEGVEVLRGPQGLLFGRNVTGGAVLLRTSRPTDEFTINARAAQETGSNQYYSAVISGPLGDTTGGKIAAYYNDDGGWHTNLFNGEDFGKAETKLIRAALEFEPSDVWDVMLRLEHGDSSGDGPAAQNAGLFSADTFDFSINDPGYYESDWDQAIMELTVNTGPGDGQIVNIFGWREYSSGSGGDIDASPLSFFHSNASIDHDQFSNELRYTATVASSYVTMGLYYLEQELAYREQRLLPILPAPFRDITGGGDQDQSTWGMFFNLDMSLTDDITLNLGARYSQEEKHGRVANIQNNQCVINGDCASYNLDDKETWSSLSPKIGFQVTPTDDTQLYAFWTRGFRSGGYNLRHTSFLIPNEVFDQETQNSYEVGLKKDIAGGRVRVNAAAYYNTIEDLQRELNFPDVLGVVQIIRNTADATITGFDLEVAVALSESLFMRGSMGYVDGNYDEVFFDLNSDGTIDSDDLSLALPRLAPWSYGAELIYSRDFNFGNFQAQASGYRRDPAAYTDNNLGWLRAADMFDASLSVTFWDDQLKLSVFGRNLKDEVTIGGDTQLPSVFPGGPTNPVPGFSGPGATFSPLNKGRTYGVELQWRPDF